jgi:hypothetical protein
LQRLKPEGGVFAAAAKVSAEFASLSDEERIGYNRCIRATTKQKASQCRLRGAAPLSIKHPGRLLDLGAAIEARTE